MLGPNGQVGRNTGRQGRGGQNGASTEDRRALPRALRSCRNVGQSLLYRDGLASVWKALFRDTGMIGKGKLEGWREPQTPHGNTCPFLAEPDLVSVTECPQRNTLQALSASFLSSGSVSLLPSSPGPSGKHRLILRKAFVKTPHLDTRHENE